MAIAQRLRVCGERRQTEDKADGAKKIAHFEDEEEKAEEEEGKMMRVF